MFKKITEGLARDEEGTEVSWGWFKVGYSENGKHLVVFAENNGSNKGGSHLTVVFPGQFEWEAPHGDEQIPSSDYQRIKQNISDGLRALATEKDELEFVN